MAGRSKITPLGNFNLDGSVQVGSFVAIPRTHDDIGMAQIEFDDYTILTGGELIITGTADPNFSSLSEGYIAALTLTPAATGSNSIILTDVWLMPYIRIVSLFGNSTGSAANVGVTFME